jgi:Na+/H+ antiporter NhaC
VTVFCAIEVVALVVFHQGYRWEDIVTGKVAFEPIVTPIFILLAVGALIGTWGRDGIQGRAANACGRAHGRRSGPAHRIP